MSSLLSDYIPADLQDNIDKAIGQVQTYEEAEEFENQIETDISMHQKGNYGKEVANYGMSLGNEKKRLTRESIVLRRQIRDEQCGLVSDQFAWASAKRGLERRDKLDFLAHLGADRRDQFVNPSQMAPPQGFGYYYAPPPPQKATKAKRAYGAAAPVDVDDADKAKYSPPPKSKKPKKPNGNSGSSTAPIDVDSLDKAQRFYNAFHTSAAKDTQEAFGQATFRTAEGDHYTAKRTPFARPL